ncbi:DUF551 domain-containing protein [Nitrosomonas oligotropha]|uniref:DUF551 domain-containing protein n=1 Tax=Nitrosomonas oligotropha TaxID=42354 RepID=UPI00136D6448|nr:DUF551 domain-containing protein [Nitrosomonas oligotropha]
MVADDWIPVTERTPIKGESVIVANRYWVDYGEGMPGRWDQHVYIALWSGECADSNITHWMPKPPLPRIDATQTK